MTFQEVLDYAGHEYVAWAVLSQLLLGDIYVISDWRNEFCLFWRQPLCINQIVESLPVEVKRVYSLAYTWLRGGEGYGNQQNA